MKGGSRQAPRAVDDPPREEARTTVSVSRTGCRSPTGRLAFSLSCCHQPPNSVQHTPYICSSPCLEPVRCSNFLSLRFTRHSANDSAYPIPPSLSSMHHGTSFSRSTGS